MNILITNDDGIYAPGIQALVKSLPDWVHAVVTAPATEKSACGHSISLKDKLKIENTTVHGRKAYVVHGTPADSVKFAFSSFSDFSPDLVISGINQGTNTGVSVYYSGTIAAAREAFINGVPAIAISLASRHHRDFDASCQLIQLLIESYKAKHLPTDTMLSINVPALAWKDLQGIKVTKQAPSRFVQEFVHEGESDGNKIFSLAGDIEVSSSDGTSDEEAIAHGFISITPLRLDLSHYEMMPALEEWAKRMNHAKK